MRAVLRSYGWLTRGLLRAALRLKMPTPHALTDPGAGDSHGPVTITDDDFMSLREAFLRASKPDDLDDAAWSVIDRMVAKRRAANGGAARAKNMSAKARSKAASMAAKARWAQKAERDGVTHGGKRR